MSSWPQLAPISRSGRSGLSLVGNRPIVELLGPGPNGVGFEIGVAFSCSTSRASSLCASLRAVMLAVEHSGAAFEDMSPAGARHP